MRHPLALVAASLTLVAGCMVLPPAALGPSPAEACRALQESLVAVVPPGESLAELQARGIRMRTPLNLPPGAAPGGRSPSGAAVRMLIQPDGTVAAGSPRTLKSAGEPQFASAVEAGALSMSFDFDQAARPSVPIPFTTTFAACGQP